MICVVASSSGCYQKFFSRIYLAVAPDTSIQMMPNCMPVPHTETEKLYSATTRPPNTYVQPAPSTVVAETREDLFRCCRIHFNLCVGVDWVKFSSSSTSIYLNTCGLIWIRLHQNKAWVGIGMVLSPIYEMKWLYFSFCWEGMRIWDGLIFSV